MRSRIFRLTMKRFLQYILGSLILISVASTGTQMVFAQEERVQTHKERVEELRAKAESARERALESASRKREERQEEKIHIKLQENTQSANPDTENFNAKVEQFRQAREQFHQNPSSVAMRKTMLLHVVDAFRAHTQLLKEQVDRFPIIHEDLKNSLLAEIEADQAALEEFRLEIQAAKTIEELKALAEQLGKHRKEVTEQKVRKLMLLAHIGVFEYRILDVAAARAAKIEEALDALEARGQSTTESQSLLAAANAKIQGATNALEELKETIIANDIDRVQLRDAQKALRDATHAVREAYQLFRDIARETR